MSIPPVNQFRINLEDLQRRMIGHALLILLIGLLAGIGLLISLIGGIEVYPGHIVALALPGSAESWVRIHLGQMLNAFLVILVALILPVLGYDARSARNLAWLTLGTGWANTIFYWAALFAPNRALTFGNNPLGNANAAAVIGLLPALVFAVVSIIVVAMLAARAFSQRRQVPESHRAAGEQ